MICVLVHAGTGGLVAENTAPDKEASLRGFMQRTLLPERSTFTPRETRAAFDLVVYHPERDTLRNGPERHPIYLA